MKTHDLVAELKGTICRCGNGKPTMFTFCRKCYGALPRVMGLKLYKRIGEGYEEAYAAAVEFLQCKESLA